MDNQRYTVILVHSISHAVKAERLLNQAGIACKLIPVPRQFSSQCGVCVRLLRADKDRGIDALNVGDLAIEGVYDYE